MTNVVTLSERMPALRLTKNGTIREDLANAMLACRHMPFLRHGVYYDEFSRCLMISGAVPWGGDVPRKWADYDTAKLTEHFQHLDMPFKYGTVETAILTVGEENKRHPLREWLDGLEWDRERRLGTWLQVYMGCKPIPFLHAVGPAWMISAVARVYAPGCKVDHMLVLEGEQGIGKSSALRVLAGDAYFTDELPDLNSKDAPLQLLGSWIVEMAELDAMNRAETSRVKSFITASVDKYRPPYGRLTVSVPRTSVFAGTVNQYDYLKDTQNRRFWPAACAYADTDGLARDRDQLWAEAVWLYRDGAAWWLRSPEEKQAATHEQSLRRCVDAWETSIMEYVAGVDDFSIPEILSYLGLPRDRWDRGSQVRVGMVVNAMSGLHRYRTTGGVREWRYRRY